jgi:hypothetical protein
MVKYAWVMMLCLAAGAAWAQGAAPISNLYMLITDRFVNGSRDNDQQFYHEI